MLNRKSWIIIILVLIFTAPAVIAHYVFHVGGITHQVNRGKLLQPVKALDQLSLYNAKDHSQFDTHALQHQWQIVYVALSKCANDCVNHEKFVSDNLHKIRQVHVALGKDQNRVGRIFITTQASIKVEDGALLLLANEKDLQHFFGKQIEGFYIVDPLGNVMMRYPTDVPHKNVYDDLTRLLNVSQVG